MTSRLIAVPANKFFNSKFSRSSDDITATRGRIQRANRTQLALCSSSVGLTNEDKTTFSSPARYVSRISYERSWVCWWRGAKLTRNRYKRSAIIHHRRLVSKSQWSISVEQNWIINEFSRSQTLLNLFEFVTLITSAASGHQATKIA